MKFPKSESGQAGLVFTIIAAVIVVGVIVFLAFWHRVPPGQVGILIDYGKGTTTGQPQIEPVLPGRWYFVGPLQDLQSYPFSQQSLIMVRSTEEGQIKGDDSVECKDSTGIKVNVDMTTIWKIKPDEISALYLNYPKRDINEVSDQLVRRISRQAVADACGQFGFIDIAGLKRIEFGEKVTTLLGPSMSNEHLELVDVSIGEVYLEPDQQKAITDKSVAEQQALQAKFLLEQRKAEAEAAIAQADGQRQVKILQAQGEAEAIRIVTEQLGAGTEYYIRYLYVKEWNGVLPYVLVTSDGKEYQLIQQLPEGMIPPIPTSDYPMPTPTATSPDGQ